LADDPEGRDAIGRQARASVRRRFQEKRLISDVVDLYSGLVQGPNSTWAR
jgi:hypothetical protein